MIWRKEAPLAAERQDVGRTRSTVSTRDRTASVVLILAGLFTTAWTVLNVSRALSWVPPGDGVGAVSIGLALGLVSFLVPLLLNWSVTKAAPVTVAWPSDSGARICG